MANWLIASVVSNQTAVVERQLKRRNISYFIPWYQDRIRRKGKEYLRSYQLYPSYIFVHSPQLFYFLLDLIGVLGIVARKGDGVPLRSDKLDHSIEELIQRRDEQGFLPSPPKKTRRSKYRRGSKVKIISGMFRGYYGLFEDLMGERAGVEIELLGGSVISVNEDDLIAA